MTARLISNAALWGMHTAQGRTDAIREWVRANGIDPNVVPVHEDMTIEDTPDGRIIRFHAYRLAEDGSKQITQQPDGGALVEERTVPLVVEPPADWPVYAVPDSLQRHEATTAHVMLDNSAAIFKPDKPGPWILDEARP